MRETNNKVITDADVADAPRDYRVVRNVKNAMTRDNKQRANVVSKPVLPSQMRCRPS